MVVCGPIFWLADWAAFPRRLFRFVKCLREILVTYGSADELSSDGAPELTAEETQRLLTTWGVHHRLLSVALSHSNHRAELGVKTCEHILMDNTGPNNEINLDKF